MLKCIKTGNGNDVNQLKIALEKLVKSHQVNLFLADFTHLKPQGGGGGGRERSKG